jgi:hypothetical protein
MAKDFEYYYARVRLFDDSVEVANGVDSLYGEGHGLNYWPREASIHILGLWEVAKHLAAHGKRMRRRIKELEAQLNE